MILSIEIHNSETEKSYFITKKDGRLWLENEDEEGGVIAENQLYQVFDEYFTKEL